MLILSLSDRFEVILNADMPNMNIQRNLVDETLPPIHSGDDDPTKFLECEHSLSG